MYICSKVFTRQYSLSFRIQLTSSRHVQTTIPPTPNDTNVTGKTVIITGGNSGLGFEAARQFLLLGASRIILACRSAKRGQEAVSTVKADHQKPRPTRPPSETILDFFDNPYKFNRFTRYADSKLAVNAYIRRLATLAPSEVIVNNLCPGLVQTELNKNLPTPLKLVMQLVRKTTTRSAEEGDRTLIHTAVTASTETNGRFVRNNKIDP